MKILITGAAGFIGTNLVSYLQQYLPDVQFIYISRTKTNYTAAYTWNELTELPGDIDAVVHLAGLAHDTRKTNDDSAYDKVNYDLTRHLYDWFLKSNATKFIYASSVKAVADSVNGILTEDATPNPLTPYGISKLRAEQYIQQTGSIPGKSYYLLRPCMVHGPGNKGNLNLLYQFVKKGIPYPLAAFDNQRSFLSIENFCFVCKGLLTKAVPSGAYNLADDEPLSTTELVKTIATASGKKPLVWNISQSLIKAIASLGDKMKLPLNTERLQKLTENYVVSNAKIKSALSIKNMPITVRDGIATTIKSFRQ